MHESKNALTSFWPIANTSASTYQHWVDWNTFNTIKAYASSNKMCQALSNTCSVFLWCRAGLNEGQHVLASQLQMSRQRLAMAGLRISASCKLAVLKSAMSEAGSKASWCRRRHRHTGLTFHGAYQCGIKIKLEAGSFGYRGEVFCCGHWPDVRWCVLRLGKALACQKPNTGAGTTWLSGSVVAARRQKKTTLSWQAFIYQTSSWG